MDRNVSFKTSYPPLSPSPPPFPPGQSVSQLIFESLLALAKFHANPNSSVATKKRVDNSFSVTLRLLHAAHFYEVCGWAVDILREKLYFSLFFSIFLYFSLFFSIFLYFSLFFSIFLYFSLFFSIFLYFSLFFSLFLSFYSLLLNKNLPLHNTTISSPKGLYQYLPTHSSHSWGA